MKILETPCDYLKSEEVYHNTIITDSYWAGNTGHELLESTVPLWLRKNAAEVPDRIAIVEGIWDYSKRRRWTYAELLRDAERIATSLLNRFKPGERVAIMAPNVVEYTLIQYGLAIAGLTMVTLNPAYHIREIEHILKKVEVSGIFVLKEWRCNKMMEIIQQVSKYLPTLREIIKIEELETFMNSGKPVEFPEVTPLTTEVIMFTSGTTGTPKGAMLNHRGMTNSTRFMALRAGMPKNGVWVNVMPMQHMGGNGFAVLGTLQQQGTLVQALEFDVKLFLELVESEKGVYALLVPTMLEAILDYPDRNKFDISSLKYIQSGASKVEASLVYRIKKELGCKMSIVCGQTEMHGGYTQTHLDDSPEDKSETIGQPYPLLDIKIGDRITGKVLPLGEEGEICCRGYQVMDEYINDPEETAKVIDNEGWLHSGDLGTIDERGFVRFSGRLKDMVVRGGVNIYPAEVEAVLEENPKVKKVAVVGVDDEYWGEQVAACIVPESFNDIPTIKELDALCLENLARFKRPRYYVLLEDFPITSTGKLRKFQLKEEIQNGILKTETINDNHDKEC